MSTCSAYWIMFSKSSVGRAIAQAVSRWLPIAAAQVRARVWSCGICGGQSGAGAGFLQVLRFPLPIFIPPIAPQSPSSIMWGLSNRPEVAAVPSGLSPTPRKKSPWFESGISTTLLIDYFMLSLQTRKKCLDNILKEAMSWPCSRAYLMLTGSMVFLTGCSTNSVAQISAIWNE
jgi:hypothetical protein